MSTETKEVVERQNTLPAVMDFGADAGMGNEGLDRHCFAIPMIYVLQDLSKQVKRPTPQKPNPDFIEGALPGMFFNNLTGEIYDSEKGLKGILCFVKHSYNLWVPRDEGGGFRGELDVATGEQVLKLCMRNDKGHDIVQEGPYKDLQLVDTRTHYFLIIHEDGTFDPVAVPFTSTAISEHKKWCSLSAKLTKGKPMFSQLWNMIGKGKENAQGSWTVPAAKHIKELTADMVEAYQAAKDFYKMITSGGTVDTHSAQGDDEIPF